MIILKKNQKLFKKTFIKTFHLNTVASSKPDAIEKVGHSSKRFLSIRKNTIEYIT